MNKFRDLIVDNINDAKIIFVGLPYDKGCSVGRGSRFTPRNLRKLSYHLPPFTMDGMSIEKCKIFDIGDIKSCKNYHNVVYKKLNGIFEYGKFPLFIGGDHSVSIPTQKLFLEHCKKNNYEPVIIHLDAHPDICDYYDNSYYSHACTIKRAIDNGYSTECINLIGIRGFEKQEVEFLDKHQEIKVFTSSFVNEFGFEQVLDYLVNKYSDSKYLIYLSYDIDINDPAFAPGTGTPEAFGVNSTLLIKFIKELYKKLNIGAMDLVEISPKLDNNDITSWLGLKTLYEIFEILCEGDK